LSSLRPVDEPSPEAGGGMIADLIRLARPKQWVKNLLVLAAIFFAGDEARRQGWAFSEMALKALAGFASFCLLSGAVYTLNDIMDRKRDAQHPHKRHRPIAAGRVPLAVALIYLFLLAGAGLSLAYFYLHLPFFEVACLYVTLNLLYSFWFKNIVILDVLTIAIGFVLRAVAGVRAIVEFEALSKWLLICTFFLALLLGVAKRRGEKLALEGRNDTRPILQKYPLSLLDQLVGIAAVTTLISYAVYTVSAETIARLGTDLMFYTIPFVTYSVLRYLYLMYYQDKGESPTAVLLTDRPLQLGIVLYVITAFIILYIRPGTVFYSWLFGS